MSSMVWKHLLLLSFIFGIVSGTSNEDKAPEASDDAQSETTMETFKEETKDLKKMAKLEEEILEMATGKETAEEMEKMVTEAEEILAEDKEKIKELETELEKEKGKEGNEKTDKDSNIEAEEEILHEAGEAISEAEEVLKEISTVIPKLEIPEESLTSAPHMHVTGTSMEKEEAPEDTYAVWNSKGKICLLAKFGALFSIISPSKGGEQKSDITLPQNGNVKGKCESSSRSPLLQISWQTFTYTMMFNKSDEENWVVTSIELTYDTSEPVFDGATNAGKKTARSKALSLFETPFGKSAFCPHEEAVLLYTGNKQLVTARLKDVHLQPYEVEEAKFSSAHHCNKVLIDGPGETFVQDETVPLAVGCTLALITLILLVGFSVHRAYHAAKVDYNTME